MSKKPIVFFSHSAKDAQVLQTLKSSVAEKTNGMIEIFLSTDGQSIPFGKNWVSKIENALTSTALMLVFVSPNSLTSHWLFFEAGFAYSKGVSVVPIGILGVDLNTIPAPLNLLQGFNISANDGLNNIMVVINKAFNATHPESFTADEFTSIFGGDAFGVSALDDQYWAIVDKLRIKLPCTNDLIMDLVRSNLQSDDLDFQEIEGAISTYGMTLSLLGGGDSKILSIVVDAYLARRSLKLLDQILPPDGLDKSGELVIEFVPKILRCSEQQKITSRLIDTEVSLEPSGNFLFRDYGFSLHAYPRLGVHMAHEIPQDGSVFVTLTNLKDSFSEIPVFELIALLFKRGIIWEGYSSIF